jgi:hypothetical protein
VVRESSLTSWLRLLKRYCKGNHFLRDNEIVSQKSCSVFSHFQTFSPFFFVVSRIMTIFATRNVLIKSIMPKIFEYFGFIFYFFSNEHEPIHVHVLHGDKESIFDLIMMDGNLADIHVREKKGADPLSEKDKRTAEEFIRKYHKNIIQKWVKFFVLKQSVRSTRINKKL